MIEAYTEELLISLLKVEEKNFYQNKITSNENNLRKVWAIIKMLSIRTKARRNRTNLYQTTRKYQNQVKSQMALIIILSTLGQP